ncbi:MAG: SIR2 family protein [Ignavibacteria bacterium]
MNINHDPSEYIRGIQQILISDKKRIGFLFGAGSSLARKNHSSLIVPAIGKMTAEIIQELCDKNSKYKTVFNEIEDEIGKDKFNVETILSNLELKLSIIGKSVLNSLKKDEFGVLISELKRLVRKKVSVHNVLLCDISSKKEFYQIAPKDIVEQLVQTDFANWIGQAERKYPIEIFTTNYDLLFELGLEHKEIPYYDGFCGSLRPFFNPESVEDFEFLSKQTKLWKIHGSLGWHFDKDTEKILRVNPDDDDILIYPSSLKYKDSKKQPYESLLDRLSNFLKKDDSILITCGYSWGDEHINSRIFSALKTNTTSHVIGLVYDKYMNDKGIFEYSLTPDSKLSDLASNNSKISIYGVQNAVIGCDYGEWKFKVAPSKEDQTDLYFNFDEGEFLLPDFNYLVTFLNSMINDNEIKKLGANVKK